MSDLQDNYKGVFDGRLGFGKRPALLIVDFINAYTTEGAPLYAPDVVTAVKETVDLLSLAREKNIPVLYTKVLYNKNFRDSRLLTVTLSSSSNMHPHSSVHRLRRH